MPKYYEISEVAAKRAKDMNSYSDPRRRPGSNTAAAHLGERLCRTRDKAGFP